MSKSKKQVPSQNVAELFEFGKNLVSDLFDDLRKELQTQVGDNVRFCELVMRIKPLYDKLISDEFESEEAFCIATKKTFSEKPQKTVKGEKK